MIYVTGDTHGPNKIGYHSVDGVLPRLNTTDFPEQKDMTKDDYVIILGDFGLVWNLRTESGEEKNTLDWLKNKPFTTLFVDGNHENFDRLYAYPEKDWHGGRVHELRPSVLHLMRGYVFEINEKSIFAFGGAPSHDIRDGILDINDYPTAEEFKTEYRKLREKRALFRINHVSWWKEELPNQAEMERGLTNLKVHDNKVDFIISHSCPGNIARMIVPQVNDPLSAWFDSVAEATDFGHWYFGHFHDNRNIYGKYHLLYEQMVRIV